MRASGYTREANDWYVEPRWLVDAVIEAEMIGAASSCWDPSCGAGNIPKALQARGIECFGSDIVDRGFGQKIDFFNAAGHAEIIISNPPFGVIEAYIRRALTLASDRVIILARLALLEGVARQKLFRETPFARVWVSSKRASMPPGGSDARASGGAIAYAWFVFEHGHVGPATIDHLPIAPEKPKRRATWGASTTLLAPTAPHVGSGHIFEGDAS